MLQIVVPSGTSYEALADTYGVPSSALRAVNPGSGELVGGQTINLPMEPDYLKGTGWSYTDDAVEQMDRMRAADALSPDVGEVVSEQRVANKAALETKLDGVEVTSPDKPIPDDGTEAPLSNPADYVEPEPETDPERSFLNRIQQIETGGNDNPWIRTQATGTGSSAYGPYQVTKGLTDEYLAKNPHLFSSEEAAALKEASERQTVSLAIGGSDREKFATGGEREADGRRLAQTYGYKDVESFLDAFDYGGDLGYKGDKKALLSAQEKMLKDTLRKAGGNEAEAAAIWHGGPGWKQSSNAPITEQYLTKYRELYDADKAKG